MSTIAAAVESGYLKDSRARKGKPREMVGGDGVWRWVQETGREQRGSRDVADRQEKRTIKETQISLGLLPNFAQAPLRQGKGTERLRKTKVVVKTKIKWGVGGGEGKES